MKLIDADALVADRNENGMPWHLGEREAFRQLVERQPEIHRLTPEEERLIELGRAYALANKCGYVLTLDNVWELDGEGKLLEWYKEETK